MKRYPKLIRFFGIMLCFLLLDFKTAYAIEGGSDAFNSPFVVPVNTVTRAGFYNGCSGALLSPYIVATAGHCIVGTDGLISREIYVGEAGQENSNDFRKWSQVANVEITSSYQGGADGKVGKDDIVFLILGSPLKYSTSVRLASEAEIVNFNSSKSQLKILGYGLISDKGETSIKPRLMNSAFSPIAALDSNAAYAVSTNSDVCSGDSGGPVLSINANEIIVVGIVTGSATSVKCTKVGLDGNYLTLFSIISRYTNLAFAAATKNTEKLIANNILSIKKLEESIAALEEENSGLIDANADFNDENEKLKLDNENLNTTISDNQENIANLEKQIAELQAQIELLKEQIPTTISCIKGKLIKKVTAVNPKCPSGYKKK